MSPSTFQKFASIRTSSLALVLTAAGCGRNLTIVDPITAASVRGQTQSSRRAQSAQPATQNAANPGDTPVFVSGVAPAVVEDVPPVQMQNPAQIGPAAALADGVVTPAPTTTPPDSAAAATTSDPVVENAAPAAPSPAPAPEAPFPGPLPASPPVVTADPAETPVQTQPQVAPAAPTPPIVAVPDPEEPTEPVAPAQAAAEPASPPVTATEPPAPVPSLPTPPTPAPIQNIPAQLHAWLLDGLARHFLTVPTVPGVYPSTNAADYGEAARWVYFSAIRPVQTTGMNVATNCQIRDFISDFPAQTMPRATFDGLRGANGIALPYLVRAPHGRRLAVVPYIRGNRLVVGRPSMQLLSVDMSRLPARGDLIPGTIEARLHARVVSRYIARRSVPIDSELLCSPDVGACTGEFFSVPGLQGHINARFGEGRNTGRNAARNSAYIEMVRKTLLANSATGRRRTAVQIPLFPADMRRIFTATGEEWTEAQLLQYLYGSDSTRGRSLNYVLGDETTAVEFAIRVRALVQDCAH